jgi:DHA1 family bicyclomycin/chloramphenicol resistance-like MFS transporter
MAPPMRGDLTHSDEFQLGRAEFIALMAMIMALQALGIDAMLPALGTIAAELGARDPNERQLIVGVYLIAAGLGSLFPGALADRFGRRPVLFGALGCYVILSLACAVVGDFQALLVLRVLQALTCAGLAVLPNAIIRDRFAGDRMASMLSTVSMVFLIVPILAPSFGQAVLLVAGWRWIFGAMAVLGSAVALWAWLRLPETLNPAYRQRLDPLAIGANMWQVASNRASIGYVIGAALVTGGLFGFINSAQQLVAEHFGAGARFPLIFAACAASMAVANFTNARIVERFGARRVSHTALLVFITVSALQVWEASSASQSLWQFVPLMMANMCLIGFIGANFGSIALQPFERTAGAASSFQMFARMLIGSGIGAVIGQAYDGSARPLALGLLLGALLSLVMVLLSERGRLFRRLTLPGAMRPIPDTSVR